MFERLASLLKRTWQIFSTNQALRRAAAISFYTATSIAPVLIIVVAVAGLAFGEDAARGAVFTQFRGLIGAQSADLLQQAISSSASEKPAGILASLISVVGLILTGSGVFLELEDALNSIWEVEAETGLWSLARARVASLGLVVALGFLLMVSLVIDAGLKGFSGAIDTNLPFGADLLLLVSFVISVLLIGLLFAAIYKLLPAKPIAWRDVWFGAAATALLFEAGKFLIGLYLGSTSSVSSLGAAGALLAVLFWVYYSAIIFLFGAALTRAYAKDETRAVKPGSVTSRA